MPPPGATMVPVLMTLLPTSATMPPWVAMMEPALRTSAVLLLACSTVPPLAALNDTRSSVLAMKPPTVT